MNTENPKLIPVPIPEGASISHAGNYLVVSGVPNHPLANESGTFPYHRFVLWQHLSQPDSSRCKWCGYPLPWKTRLYFAASHVVNVDHLDADTNNNTPENLAPSCYWCNVTRSWAEKCPKFWADWRRWMADVPPVFRPKLLEIAKEQGIVPEDFKPEAKPQTEVEIPHPEDDAILDIMYGFMRSRDIYRASNQTSPQKFRRSMERLVARDVVEHFPDQKMYLRKCQPTPPK